MDLREYEQHKFAITDLLRQMGLAAPDKQRWRDQATGLFTRLAEDRFNLVLVGRFSRGKTSLMNAILGMDRLPTGIVPLTSVITSVAYGSVERVRLRFTKSFMDEDVPLASLPQFVTQQGNPGNAKGIKEAEVQLPAEILRRGFYFIDMPGLGSAIEENTRTTESYLPEADAFLLVTSFDGPLSGEEMRFLREVSSSSRRVFVVLNKQDTVNDEERGEALGYVRRKLDATFERKAPKLFSVSARQALEAKQAHDYRRLEASGILFLEQELVDFLLSQKRSAFLLRMCDRQADLARGYLASDQASLLVEKIAALSRRIAVDSPGPAPSEPAEASATSGPTAAQLRPCEICAAVSSALWEFQRRFQYEIMINRTAQHDLAAHGGLCSFHIWQYEANASPQGVSEGYPPVLEDWAAWMRGAASDVDILAVAEKLKARLPNETSCVLCRVRGKAESEAIAALSRRFAVEGSQALNSLSALCLPHFARFAGTLGNERLIRELMTPPSAATIPDKGLLLRSDRNNWKARGSRRSRNARTAALTTASSPSRSTGSAMSGDDSRNSMSASCAPSAASTSTALRRVSKDRSLPFRKAARAEGG